jgi:hypothetical protein
MPWTVIADPIKQLSDYVKTNWPNAAFEPLRDEIAWNSWASPLANCSFMIEDIATDPMPLSLGWGLIEYRQVVRIHMWTAYIGDRTTDVVPPILKNSREQLDKFLTQNAKGLSSTGINRMRPWGGARYQHDPDPNSDKWQLIFPVAMWYYKNI